MPRRDTRVTDYINVRAAFARPILRHLRKTIHDLQPFLTETIKWGMPTFTFKDKIVCGVAGFKAHCAQWFWNGDAVVGKKPAEAMPGSNAQGARRRRLLSAFVRSIDTVTRNVTLVA